VECIGDVTKAEKYPASASPYGVLDMSGNIWDWTGDFYVANYYEFSPKINPLGPETGTNKVIRGACWVNNPNQLRVANRFYAAPRLFDDDIGFRCAVSP
jgi:formylglycine-generating enzyme required for sulfatase activity